MDVRPSAAMVRAYVHACRDVDMITSLLCSSFRTEPVDLELVSVSLATCLSLATRFLPYFNSKGYLSLVGPIFELYLNVPSASPVRSGIEYTMIRFHELHGDPFLLQRMPVGAPPPRAGIPPCACAYAHRWRSMCAGDFCVSTVLQAILPLVEDDAHPERRALLVLLFAHMETLIEVDELGVSGLALPHEPNPTIPAFQSFSVVRLLLTLVAFEPATQRAVSAMRFLTAILPSLFASTRRSDLVDNIDLFVRSVIGSQLESLMCVVPRGAGTLGTQRPIDFAGVGGCAQGGCALWPWPRRGAGMPSFRRRAMCRAA